MMRKLSTFFTVTFIMASILTFGQSRQAIHEGPSDNHQQLNEINNAKSLSQTELLVSWQGDSGIDLIKEETDVADGDYSLKVSVNTGSQGDCDLEDTTAITVTPGDTYKVAFKYKTSAGVRGRFIPVWDSTADYNNSAYFGDDTTEDAYDEFSMEGTVPSGSSTFNFHVRFYDQTDFSAPEIQYLDSSIVETPTGSDNLLQNGSFETWQTIAPTDTSIYAIQYVGTDGDASTLEGEFVSTTGVVTATHSDGYVLQDSVKAWNGIWVADSDHSPAVGDTVNIEAYVQENYGLTRLYDVQSFNIQGSGTAPDPLTVTTGEAGSEMYEGVLVKVEEVSCNNPDAGYGEWLVNDGSDTLVVDAMLFDYSASKGSLYSLTGVMNYSYGAFKLEPRNADDIVAEISGITHTPETVTPSDAVNISAEINDTKGTIETAELRWGTASDALDDTISMTTSRAAYSTDSPIPAQSDGAMVYFEIYAKYENGNEMTTMEELSYSVNQPVTNALPYSQAFDADLGNIMTYSVSGDSKEWQWDEYSGNGFAMMNGYGSGDTEEDWLILPEMNFDNSDSEIMTFDTWYNYGTDDENNYLKLYYSTDYSGTGDPSEATWTELNYNQGDSQTWTSSGDIDLSGISGSAYIAFKYHYEPGSYRQWEVDNIFIREPATPLPYSQTFDADLGDVMTYSISGDSKEWQWSEYSGNGFAAMNGYDSGDTEIDWLILPKFNFDDYDMEVMTFDTWYNYGTDDENNYLKLYYSTDYSGSGDPSEATWTELNYNQGDSQAWTSSGEIDLSNISGNQVYIGFKYRYEPGMYRQWEVDNIVVEEAPSESLTVTSPNGGEYWNRGTTKNITWTSDGISGNVKIELTGSNAQVIEASVENTGSYSWDIPSDITLADDYKVAISDVDDGAPADTSDAAFSIIDAIYFEAFAEDLGEWTTYSVTGDDQTWIQDSYGGREYAKISGHDGDDFENEDWLISPNIDLSEYANIALNFEEAINYGTGNIDTEQEVYVSTDYSGSGDPTSDGTWTKLTVTGRASGDSWDFVAIDEIDLSDYDEESTFYVAFKYASTTDGAATWEVDNVKLTGESTTGIADNELSTNMALYPNPSNGKFTVAAEEFDNARVAVYSITGAKVYETHMQDTKQTINLSNLNKGVYTVRFITKDRKVAVKQVIIQ